MKIIKDLVINGELNPELKDLKCYVIINKHIDGMGFPGYAPYKVLIYDKSIAGGCLAHPIGSTGIDKNFILYFDESNTEHNPLVITDNEHEAEILAKQFNQFGYCSCETELAKISDKVLSLTRFFNFMHKIIKDHQESFDKDRIDNDDRVHKEFIEFAKNHYPRYLTNMTPDLWNDRCHGSCVFLKYINSDGTAIYHYPDSYGCWDVTVAMQLDDQKIIGINNGCTPLDCEWYPISESDFLSSFNTGDLDNMTGTKLSYLTNGKYK